MFRDRPILEVRSPNPVGAMTALDQMPFVEKTSLFGTAVHAVLRSSAVSPDQVRTALTSQHIMVTGLEPVIPSLEDVFLDVVDRMETGQRQ